jgi:hypothetical protein
VQAIKGTSTREPPSESESAGLLPDLGVSRRGDHSTPFAAEQTPIRGDAELFDVLPKDLDEFWRDRDPADVILASMLETAQLVSITCVGPSAVHLRA